MGRFQVWGAQHPARTFLLSFLFFTLGLTIYLGGASPDAAAANQPHGGFYSLSSGPYGQYSAGGTAILDWRDFEPEEGVYRWELLKNPNERYLSWLTVYEARSGKPLNTVPAPAAAVYSAHSSGKKVRLKLRVTEGAMPLWLYGGEDAQGVRSGSYGTICACKTYAQAWSKTVDCNPQSDIVIAITYPLYPTKEDNAQPVWWNPIFQEKMIKVLKVIGNFVENDPVYSSAVEFVEASVGSYGEMILYGKSSTHTFDGIDQKIFRGAGYTNARYSEGVQRLIAGYMESFPSFPIGISLGNGLYSSPYEDGSGVTSVLADVLHKLMPRYGSRLYLKFAGFGGNRADHTFKDYCPDKTRCIYETFGGISQWFIDGIEFPFFCYANRPIPERKPDLKGIRPECVPSPCWNCDNGEEKRIIEPPSAGAARFKKVLNYAVDDKAYIVMMWQADWKLIDGAQKAVPGLTADEESKITEQYLRAMGEIASQLEALGKVNPQPPATYTFTVTKEGAGTGTVTTTHINCGSVCSKTFTLGTPVTLAASAETGSTFAGWSGACSGTGPCSLTMDGNKTAIARFNSTSSVPSNPLPSSNPSQSSTDTGGGGNPSDSAGNAPNPSAAIPSGSETGSSHANLSSSTLAAGTVVDLDGDGKDDVVWFDGEPGPVFAWYLKGERFTKVNIQRDIATPNWKMAGGGNLRADGSYNIFWHNVGTGKVYAWSINRGNYIEEHFIHAVEDTNWRMVGVGDFNGDGQADLLWHHQGTGAVFIWFMNGLNFAGDQPVATVTDLRWQVVGVGDVNGDGKPDILWQHANGGALYVWYMDEGKVIRDQHIRDVEDSNWKVVGIGKFTESKNVNILWRHPVSGEIYIWHLDGGRYLGDTKIQPVIGN